MSIRQWQRLQAAFDAVCSAPPAQRTATLEHVCGSDAELRSAVVALLQHDAAAGDRFLAAPPTLAEAPSRDDRTDPPWIAPLVGQQIGEYQIQRLIAFGGMGAVFEALQTTPRRSVALKLLHPGSATLRLAARFRVEADILARLRHPNIAQVYAAGVGDGPFGDQPYFALELIPAARDIKTYADHHRLSTTARLRQFIKVCRAVHHAHQKGVIHRDLKPQNILVGGDGDPKVIDFGIARVTDADVARTTQHTHAGEIVGTLQYMSPEQCDADPAALDIRTDVYSLGVVLFEFLTGELPYALPRTGIVSAVQAIRQTEPRRLSTAAPRLRGDLEWIVHKTLQKQPAERYDSTAALADDLERYLRGEPVTARKPTPAYLIGRYVQRRPWQALTLVAGALVLLLAVTSALIWQSRATALAAQQRERLRAYGARIAAAESAIQMHDPGAAEVLLDETSTTPDLRGWEYRHLRARLDESLAQFRPPRADLPLSSDCVLAVAPNGRWAAAVRALGVVDVIDFDGETVRLFDRRAGWRARLRRCDQWRRGAAGDQLQHRWRPKPRRRGASPNLADDRPVRAPG
jgi:hypothetical protein